MITFGLRRASNIEWQPLLVGTGERARAKGAAIGGAVVHRAVGSGQIDDRQPARQGPLELGCHTMLLDGDNVRHGLNRDLGFTDTDRVEIFVAPPRSRG